MSADNFKLAEQMQGYHSTWAAADYEALTPTRRKSWLARAAAALKDLLDESRERRRVFGELAAMSNHDLADIELSRGDIRRVFDPEFAKERASRAR